MENSEKVEKFRKEINLIVDEKLRGIAEQAVGTLPDYFFEIPASSTGKYHPAYTTGEGGLYRHTVAAVRILAELFRTDMWNLTAEEKDLALLAMIVHDGFKSGKVKSEYTVTEHPLLMAFSLKETEGVASQLTPEQLDKLTAGIASHMGKWNTDYKTKEAVLPVPVDDFQKIIHLADYIASRKMLELNFDVPVTMGA